MTNSIFKSLEAQFYQGTWRAKLHTSGRNSNQSLILQQNFFFSNITLFTSSVTYTKLIMKINEILWKQPQDRFQDEEKNNYLYRLVWYVVFIETVLIIIL